MNYGSKALAILEAIGAVTWYALCVLFIVSGLAFLFSGCTNEMTGTEVVEHFEALGIYTGNNSDGPSNLASEQSRKKAAIRCYVKQWQGEGFSNCLFSCPTGEQCSDASCGSGSITVRFEDCVNPIPPGRYRQCYLVQNGEDWGVAEYCQGCRYAHFWRFGQGLQFATCDVQASLLEVYE